MATPVAVTEMCQSLEKGRARRGSQPNDTGDQAEANHFSF